MHNLTNILGIELQANAMRTGVLEKENQRAVLFSEHLDSLPSNLFTVASDQRAVLFSEHLDNNVRF